MPFSALARSGHLDREVGCLNWAYQCKVDIEELTRGDTSPLQNPKNIKTFWCLSNYFIDVVVPLKGVTQRKTEYFIGRQVFQTTIVAKKWWKIRSSSERTNRLLLALLRVKVHIVLRWPLRDDVKIGLQRLLGQISNLGRVEPIN